MKIIQFSLLIILFSFTMNSVAAVILQYHHVSDDSPASTSISPLQFEAHMQYLADNSFRVVSLSELMNSTRKQQPIPDKTVAITFDDAYLDILTHGKPILDKFNYPFTIFINPGIINQKSAQYLSWQQLKKMADEGVIIANHGFNHDSLARIPEGLNEEEWLKHLGRLLNKAEKIIEDNTGQSWRYFAYPYGEYTPAIQHWIKSHDFIAFSQQSGAVGLGTDLSAVPRFPASKPYDKLATLRDKLHALPFSITLTGKNADTIHPVNSLESATFNVIVDDFNKRQLNCYVTGIGRQNIDWQTDNSFMITFNAPLPTGRVRANCTAPSKSKPGRYYWYSKPWFILKEDNQWYPL
ncbi:polysaccharide deacetylase family protein [Colwellia sp. 1_MG-2023]|uniref:polysaccharide deacetylase family protein n=1 Tax=Colwellia sp. 1_MG-2023 TaxID=3062649 RepID=UPI0026E155E7|nr:polysaccharide deacetylase family protein [Colwellia sp. 1_MG-2023]MDO6445400.1 polysaccharide deacetylase family protein [Colwellia sp. 1_MG-2023]